MVQGKGMIVPCLIMLNERNLNIPKLMQVTSDQKVTIMNVAKTNVRLTKRAWLNRQKTQTLVNIKENSKKVLNPSERNLMLEHRLDHGDGDITVRSGSPTKHYPRHVSATLHHHPVAIRWHEGCKIKKQNDIEEARSNACGTVA